MSITAGQLKHFLSRAVRPYWASPSQRAYPGFQDPHYEPCSTSLWDQLTASAPPARYKSNVFDCEDLAMEFRVHVAGTQRDTLQNVTAPLSVGIAMGYFSWSGASNLHVVNFVVLDTRKLRWYDPQTGDDYPLSRARPGLRWLLI